MANNRRRLIVIGSAIFLSALTALSAYTIYAIIKYSIPIPVSVAVLTTILPATLGLTTQTFPVLSRSITAQVSDLRSTILLILLLLETILATLAGTHTHPASALDCGLHTRWQHLFQAKDEGAIRGIQDRFDCCGLVRTSDMAWPFPDKHTQPTECVERFRRTRSCLADWRGEEQTVASILMATNILLMLWQALIVYGLKPGNRIQDLFINNQNSQPNATSSRAATGYVEHGERYTDEQDEDEETGRTAPGGNQQTLTDSRAANHQPDLI